MDTMLNEIKQLAQQGLEKSIISRDEENKDIFMQIMLKAEVAINKVEQSSAHKSVVVEKENFSTRTYERIDEDAKSDMYLIAYCFSRFEHTSLYPQYSQDKSFAFSACAFPSSVKGESDAPCICFFWLNSVCPCRIKYSVCVMLCTPSFP